ncbi:JAB domain-containing protein [Duganella sp. BJB488]|uniref:DNA repair protein RadC n=1 Tax=Duganella vulcania TaxID=2692166 RepID=A0A845FVM7_9BURK|nr:MULTISPECIES: DNA repair protein RadC [Duganella]MYM86543.1 DNA repair protein RadC [Duganella vulcania]NVD73537.1 DNA repair protein RadC [Duganella sp. BJB1802]RFP25978.1 JAB domain-containing protein [Duganella sp. BJB489]RFP28281.1 JAB domain-containing protein [Duganella sp. BJB488]RFP36908.1 JAB domain-containing protein [Duganella sp. BJB480]
MTINEWPLERRPRERLIRDGAGALSDAELLAVFLRTGVPGKDAVQLGQEMLHHFGSLQGMFGASLPEFSALRGLGSAKFAQLQAVMELARRAILEEIKAGHTLNSPRAVKEYLRITFSGKDFESFYVLFLDVKNRLIESREMFRGTLTHTSVYPREVVKAALACNAASIMLAHNHPSGTPEPSESDLLLTRALVQAMALVDIRILDHFVVAGHQVHSFAEHGQL